MGFNSSHGTVNWSYRNYGLFIKELHSKMAAPEVAEFNSFQAYVFSEFGYPPAKCKLLAESLTILKSKVSGDTLTRLEQLIEVLCEAHAANQPLKFT